ncbi:MAG: short-subunit dehydrogenase [Paracoccaceae bacterium]
MGVGTAKGAKENTMKLVLVTGASSGVGAATARDLALKGARVILVARSESRLNTLAADIGDMAIAAPCDAADSTQVAAMATGVLTDFGVPDAIIHCAGAGQWKTVQDTTPSEAVEMMQAPYFAAFNVTRAFLPQMLERGAGVIISVNSPACVVPWPSSVGYAAARAALRGFHEALSQDLVGTGLHSCHVIFGQISSEYFDNNPGVAEQIPALSKTIPIITPAFCGSVLAKLVDKPRLSSIHPWILRTHIAFGVVFPRTARWLVRF